MNKYNIDDNYIIGLIPARGGSKSIPLKNIASLSGKPLISYVIAAGKRANSLDNLFCSTDHEGIAKVCRDFGVEIIKRPDYLSQDDTPVTDVIKNVLEIIGDQKGVIPGIVALLQPTSPFLLPQHIDDCIIALRNYPEADSSQTITPVIHNFHAFNQRIIEDGFVRFRFMSERKISYNKQKKPKHYVFGNLVVTRSRALFDGLDCFGNISVPVQIDREYSIDVDTSEDLEYASYLMNTKKVKTI